MCVCLSGFYAPLTMGQPPAVPYVLITPGARRRQCLAVYVTRVKAGTWERASRVAVYSRVFMFRLCYGLLTACEWDPCVAKKREEAIFIIKAVAAGHFLKGSRGRLVDSMTLLPALSSLSFLQTWLFLAAKRESDMRLMEARSEVVSSGFLLRMYSAFTHDEQHHFPSPQPHSSLCLQQINALLKASFLLCQQVKSPLHLNGSRRRQGFSKWAFNIT